MKKRTITLMAAVYTPGNIPCCSIFSIKLEFRLEDEKNAYTKESITPHSKTIKGKA
jgi:hypothetical protein